MPSTIVLMALIPPSIYSRGMGWVVGLAGPSLVLVLAIVRAGVWDMG